MVLGSPTRRPGRRIATARMAAIGVLASLFAGAVGPAEAGEVYTYKVVHPTFGDIGSYTDTVTRGADGYRVDSRLHVVVSVLGIVLHREDADRTEIWRGGRLVSFHGVTTTNGERIEVSGAAKDDHFVIDAPQGHEVAPADIKPSNPWSATANAPPFMMSTKTGKLFPVRDATVEPATLRIRGVDLAVQHYVFVTDKRQDVWKDARGVPVEFRTSERSGAIDFVLVDETVAAASPSPGDPGKVLAVTPR